MGLIVNTKQTKLENRLILTSQEIDALLRALSNATFSVRDIEILYSSILKLQDHRKLLDNGA